MCVCACVGSTLSSLTTTLRSGSRPPRSPGLSDRLTSSSSVDSVRVPTPDQAIKFDSHRNGNTSPPLRAPVLYRYRTAPETGRRTLGASIKVKGSIRVVPKCQEWADRQNRQMMMHYAAPGPRPSRVSSPSPEFSRPRLLSPSKPGGPPIVVACHFCPAPLWRFVFQTHLSPPFPSFYFCTQFDSRVSVCSLLRYYRSFRRISTTP